MLEVPSVNLTYNAHPALLRNSAKSRPQERSRLRIQMIHRSHDRRKLWAQPLREPLHIARNWRTESLCRYKASGPVQFKPATRFAASSR